MWLAYKIIETLDHSINFIISSNCDSDATERRVCYQFAAILRNTWKVFHLHNEHLMRCKIQKIDYLIIYSIETVNSLIYYYLHHYNHMRYAICHMPNGWLAVSFFLDFIFRCCFVFFQHVGIWKLFLSAITATIWMDMI